MSTSKNILTVDDFIQHINSYQCTIEHIIKLKLMEINILNTKIKNCNQNINNGIVTYDGYDGIEYVLPDESINLIDENANFNIFQVKILNNILYLYICTAINVNSSDNIADNMKLVSTFNFDVIGELIDDK